MTEAPTPIPPDTYSDLAGWAGSYAFVDLETTGCDPARDRIIEIAIITVDDGKVVDTWSRLIQPRVRVPASVEQLTGISEAALAEAPAFDALAEEVMERLRGRTLVAHNARFDYGFVRAALRRAGIAYRAPIVCTLHLARRLYPHLARHGLDALVERFGVRIANRHRALDDLHATVALMARFAADCGPAAIAEALAAASGWPNAVTNLPGSVQPPEAPGVYFLYAHDRTLLYVGKSTNIARRIATHFSGSHRSRRACELAQRVASIDWHETEGELGALLYEADQVKRLRPAYNRRLRTQTDQVIVRLRQPASGCLLPEIVPALEPRTTGGDCGYGPFGNRRAARRFLQRLADEHGLCPRRLGLESGRGRRPCFARQLRACRGACTGEEPAPQFNLRLLESLGPYRIPPWPWDGPVGVLERDPIREREALHVIDDWRYIGTARDEQGLAEVCARRHEAGFDRDQYRLLKRWLQRHPRSIRPLRESRAMSAGLGIV